MKLTFWFCPISDFEMSVFNNLTKNDIFVGLQWRQDGMFSLFASRWAWKFNVLGQKIWHFYRNIPSCSPTFMNKMKLFENTFNSVKNPIKIADAVTRSTSIYSTTWHIITRENRAIELIWESLQHSYSKVWWGKTALWSAAHPPQLCAISHAEFPSSASLTVVCSGVCRRHWLYRGWNEALQRLNHFFTGKLQGEKLLLWAVLQWHA